MDEVTFKLVKFNRYAAHEVLEEGLTLQEAQDKTALHPSTDVSFVGYVAEA